MRFDRLSRPGPELHRGWFFLTAAAYTLLGEILYWDNRPMMRSGLCMEHSKDHAPMMLAWAALVCVVSTSWIAMRVSEPWLPRTTLHTAAATSAGSRQRESTTASVVHSVLNVRDWRTAPTAADPRSGPTSVLSSYPRRSPFFFRP